MAKQTNKTPAVAKSSAREVSAFLGKARQLQARPSDNRLVFALDATASRQATWDRACHLQAQMFGATRRLSGLNIQLCYYRGIDEFRALPWSSNGPALRQQMLAVTCLGGHSQIERLLRHTLSQHQHANIRALVFVGDAMEEDSRRLYQLAGQLGIHRLPAFMFQEGFDPDAGHAFAEIARLSGGAHCQFNENSDQQLQELLTAVAVYAAGGVDAVKQLEQPSPLLRQLLKTLPDR
jgi:hypothetical protein